MLDEKTVKGHSTYLVRQLFQVVVRHPLMALFEVNVLSRAGFKAIW